MAYAAISKPSLYMNTVLYTGNGSTQSITGVGFQPDLTWIKSRSYVDDHVLTDAVRGVTKTLFSNAINGEETQAQGLTAFGADGFSVGSMAEVNTNAGTIASWNWKANGAGSANTDGSISSTVSVNTTAGFSIVKYTGTGSADTIGHGLGAVPKMIISKRLDTTSYWITYHEAIGNDKELYLNDTSAAAAAANTWNSTTPTSSVWSVKTDSNNTSGGSFISYVFADVAGYSKFGSYTGNGNANGTFVYTGFKPSFVLGKRTNSTEDWFMFDDKRDPYNVNYKLLYPNGNNAAYTGASDRNDFLSNGFKMRGTDGKENGSGDSYIYMAFASEPLVANVGSSIPATAR